MCIFVWILDFERYDLEVYFGYEPISCPPFYLRSVLEIVFSYC